MPGPFDRIYEDVRKDIPSVSKAIVQQELFRVCADFTQTVNIWTQDCTLAVIPNKTNYPLYSQITHGRANRLLFVYDANAPTKNWPMSGITMRVPGLIELYRTPGVTASWIAVIAKHTHDVNSDGYPFLDDWIVEKYADVLGRGVMARLQLEPQKPYSNPMLAVQNQRAYISGRSNARANDGNTNVYNAQPWRYPTGWGVTQRRGFV